MKIVFTEKAWEQYLYWQAEDRAILKRVNRLIRDIARGEQSDGIGKPERLTGNLSGFSSRRITQEHRLVYRLSADQVEIVACRFHYGP